MNDELKKELKTVTVRTACFSSCGEYRYFLKQNWQSMAKAQKKLLVIMCNPSKANSTDDDRTISSVRNQAYKNCYSEMTVINLSPFIETKSESLSDKDVPTLLGDAKNYYTNNPHLFQEADAVLCAWGALIKKYPKLKCGLPLIKKHIPKIVPIFCLELTKDGHPHHPIGIKDAKEWECFDLSQYKP